MASIALCSFFKCAHTAKHVSDRLTFTKRENYYDVQIKNCPKIGCISLQSTYDKEVNRRTWKMLSDQLNFVYGPGRVQEVCHRYGLNFTKNQKAKAPLLVKDLVKIGVGMAHIKVKDVSKLLKANATTLKPSEFRTAMHGLNPYPYLGPHAPTHQLLGGPGTTGEYFTHDAVAMEQKRLALFTDLDKLSFEGFVERFGKAIVSHEMEEGTLVPVPITRESAVKAGESIEVEYFKLYRKIAGSGLVAYALIPISKKSPSQPMLFFRPTQMSLGAEDVIESWLNDLEPKLGMRGFKSCKWALRRLLEEFPEKQWILEGYSLGGAHMARTLIDNRRRVSEAVFINNPGIDKKTVLAFAKKLNAEKGEDALPLMIRHYRTCTKLDMKKLGDKAHCAGEFHVGYKVAESTDHVGIAIIVEAPKKAVKRSLLEHHNVRTKDLSDEEFLSKIITNREETDLYLNNLDPRRGKEVLWYERFRKGYLMRALYHIIRCVYTFLKAIFAFFGCEVFRTASKRPQHLSLENLAKI